jgi:hypothetical protein
MHRVKPDSRQGIGLAVVYFCAGLLVVLDPRATHDEGLLMYGFARALREAFFPCLFFQKTKPALALVYAPVAQLGLAPYLVAHLAIASAAIAWTLALARSLDHKRPWLPALVVALSPLYTWSAFTGVSNSDGVAGAALFLYLLQARKNLFAAGLVLGLLPWIRYEQALFCAVIAPWILVRYRSLAFFAGLVTWPIAYLGVGAIYHRDPLWFVHFSPSVGNLESGNPVWISEFASHNPKTAILALAIVSPAVFFLMLVRAGRLDPLERVLGAFTALFFAAFVATHLSPLDIGPAFVLGFSSRYAVVPLVAVGLLFGRVVEAHEVDLKPRLRDTLAAGSLLVVGWFLRASVVVPLFASAAMGSFVAAARAGAKKLGLAVVLGFLVVVPLHLRDDFLREYPLRDPTVEPIAAWLEAHANELKGEVYTNHQLLGPYLQRSGQTIGAQTKFMLAVDHHFELIHLSNPANGQRAAVLDAIPRSVFGPFVPPEALDPKVVQPGTMFVLIDDVRTKQIFPPERWNERLRVIHQEGGFVVYELLP